MLTDEKLREAAAEAQSFLAEGMPETDDTAHVFSEQFEKKMDRLIRRTQHPVRYQVLRAVASILLAIATLFASVMAGSSSARAMVLGWMRETFNGYYSYSNGDVQVSFGCDYELKALPEGYRGIDTIQRNAGKTYLYENDSGNILQFGYTYDKQGNKLYINADDYKQYTIFVNEVQADIYLAKEENMANVIVWQDIQTGSLLFITATADVGELVALAESVERMN